MTPAAGHAGAPGAPLEALAAAAQRFATASSLAELARLAADTFRDLFGHDRATFSRCDAGGDLEVMAESLGGLLPPLSGLTLHAHSLPAHDRPLALRNRAQVCADARAVPSELVPRLLPGAADSAGGALDLLTAGLRSPTPLQAEQWLSLGAVGALRVAVVREGRLWGLLDCHHPQPRPLGYGARLGAELLAEVLATRLAALESYARSQIAAQVHALEKRLLDATALEGDWRRALFSDPQTLLRPLAASGALLHHEGEWLRCGEAPRAALLQPLLHWLRLQPAAGAWHCRALGAAAPALAGLSPRPCGVLAVPITASGADWLVWLRPAAPGQPEAPAWGEEHLALATTIARTLADIVVQVNAVRLLIAQRQLVQVRGAVADAQDAVVVVDTAHEAFYANEAFCALAGRGRDECNGLRALARVFTEPEVAHRMIGQVRAEQRPWQGEMVLRRPNGTTLPVAVRAEPVPGQGGALLGTIFIFQDLTATKHALAARTRFEARLADAGRALRDPGSNDLARAILANASLAGMDISEGGAPPAVAPLLEEVQASAERASSLLARIRRNSGD